MASKARPSDGEIELQIAEDIAGFCTDPYGYAHYAYPWGYGVLADSVGPRKWQGGVLRTIRNHLSNPETRFDPLLLAVASGHGIGKSALISIITNWALDTCDDARVVVTANTEPQLRTKTWPEISKWRKLGITADWFKPTATALMSTQAGHADSWRADAATWSAHNTEAFAGLHNARKRIVLIFDEASAIADKVWEVAEGALTDENTEIIWIVFGNPTRATGRFKDCFGRQRNRWKTAQIDSRTVEGTNKGHLAKLVDAYGEDSDLVRVRVRGMFPKAASTQLISSDLVAAARLRETAYAAYDPTIYGVDTARFGDDKSVCAVRRGRDARSIPWLRWNEATSIQIAGDIAQHHKSYPADAIFVDAGGPNAGGVIDQLRYLLPDVPVFEVHFGGAGREAQLGPHFRVKAWNKRAEIYLNLAAWIPTGAIPDDQDVEDDLTAVEYGYASDQTSILLEKKEDMKERLEGRSPDDGDALALTFSEEIAPKIPRLDELRGDAQQQAGHDRYAGLNA